MAIKRRNDLLRRITTPTLKPDEQINDLFGAKNPIPLLRFTNRHYRGEIYGLSEPTARSGNTAYSVVEGQPSS